MSSELHTGTINQYAIDEFGTFFKDEFGNKIITGQTTFTQSTPTCRRCGRCFPLSELTDGLCTDNNRYSSEGCYDEDEHDSEGA